jgi:hypothetical protein
MIMRYLMRTDLEIGESTLTVSGAPTMFDAEQAARAMLAKYDKSPIRISGGQDGDGKWVVLFELVANSDMRKFTTRT